MANLAGTSHLSRQDGQVGEDYGQIFAAFLRPTTQASSLIVVSEPSWCKPCLQLEPILHQLQKDGYDVQIETAAKYTKRPNAVRINSFPTLVYIKNKQAVKVQTGFKTREEILKVLGK